MLIIYEIFANWKELLYPTFFWKYNIEPFWNSIDILTE